MRVIAGKHRGRTLAGFRGNDIRPTADRVKESLFQILSSRLPGARVLDLFCGSGALGIESLSRGASRAVFNDASRESVALCKKNLRAVGEEGEVYNLDFRACLCRVSGPFDLVFCDPPYKDDPVEEVLSLLKGRALLAEGGLVVVEREEEALPAEGWERVDFRSYGRTKITLFGLST